MSSAVEGGFLASRESRSADLTDRMRNRVGLVLLMALSAALFFVNTRQGIGIYVDSTRYMGLSEVPYDAPLYPWMLQLGVLLGVSMDVTAQVLGLFFTCANTALIAHLLLRGTGRPWLAGLGTAIAVVAPQFVTLHSLAMSEPPFLFFLLLTLLAFCRYLETRSQGWLAGSAVALGIATLARFTAPPLGAAIALFVLFDTRRPFRTRVMDAGLFAALSGAIFFVWVVLGQMIEGRSTGRDLWFYGNMGAEEWLSSLGALTAWLLPDEVPFALRTLLLAVVVLTAAGLTLARLREFLSRSQRTVDTGTALAVVLGFFIVFYMGFMVLATSIEANLSLNGRYAFPAYVAAVMLMTIVSARLGATRNGRRAFTALVALAAVVLASHTVRTAVRSHEAYGSGVGYASKAWRNSPTMQALAELPGSAQIFTNGQDAVAYLLRRPARYIPNRFELRTGEEDPDNTYEAQLAQVKDAASRADTYVVFFDGVDWRFYQASEDELVKALSLTLVAGKSDGRIYRVSAPTTPSL